MKKEKTPPEFLKKIPTEYSVVLRDWRNAFPMLTPYTQRRLYVRSEIFMYGLTFMKLRFLTDEYRVYFECIPLWDEKSLTNKFPMVYFPITNEKESDVILETYLHHCKFEPYKEYIKNNFSCVFTDEVKWSDIYNLIKKFLIDKKYAHFFEKKQFVEFILAMAYYLNDDRLIKAANRRANKICKKIRYTFEGEQKITGLQWKENIVKELESREFVEQARINAQNPKIAKLRQVHFVDDYEEYMAEHTGWRALRNTLAKLFRRLK